MTGNSKTCGPEKPKDLATLSDDAFIDYLIDQAGGVGKAHICFFVAISSGINSIYAWVAFQIPYLIQR